MTLNATSWLTLIISLPTRNATVRMRIWRALKSQGCGVLRDGVYLLPQSDAGEQALLRLAEETREAGGTAHLLRMESCDTAQEQTFRQLFDRSADYAKLIDEAAKACTAPERKALKALRREFGAVAAVDFFPGEAKAQAETALNELEALLSPGEPHAAGGLIRRHDGQDFKGRLWATRKHLWVDRMASAWLIRRFIDPQARFLWLEDAADCPKDALGFDFDGAFFTHVNGRVTFEVLLASFRLDSEPGLARIGALVHYLDVGGIPAPEAAGLETVLGGACQRCVGDDELLAEASKVFDFLYAAFSECP